ncbi:MAG: phage portal protein [Bacteroidaceae bacterium]|nr:phage portal protein [Bacteroidaceae bacterium]MBR4930434.1 phage portal protein [Bacteroidaceae bacterium]
MKTFQDLMDAGKFEKRRMDFVLSAIAEHKQTDEYKTAVNAELYYKHQNPTIMRYQKIVRNLLGQPVVDPFSANHKIASNWFFYFTTQAVQYLLGNGVTFENEETKGRFGRGFDGRLQKLATYAKLGGTSFAFYGSADIGVFSLTEFVPLYDEENGALSAGIRFWQIDNSKPLRATLYEMDGYTEYIKKPGEEMRVLRDKRKYVERIYKNEVETEILDGENLPGIPIVPLFNINKQSDLVGNRGTIDAYDLMVSKLVNNVSEGDLIYWVLKNADGMDDIDDVQFLERLRTIGVAHIRQDGEVEAHKIDAPFEANGNTIEKLKNQLFSDFMALNVEQIQAGNVTATQIKAAYEPLNQKSDLFEYEVIDFIHRLCELAGVEDEPSFKRSVIANQTEETNMVLASAPYLDDETVLDKLPFITPDEKKTILERKDAEDLNRMQPETDEVVEEE